MPQYSYRATDLGGKIKRGKATHNSEEQLRKALEKDNLMLIDCSEYLNRKTRKKLKSPDLAEFCRELGSMLGSGVSLVRALGIVVQRENLSPNIKYAFTELNTQIRRGVALSDAMEMQRGKFPPLLINMVKAGEATGRLDDTMDKMAEYFEKEHRLNSDIKSATTYPKILGVLTFLVVILLFTFIVPTFTSVFEGMAMPTLTKIVMAISGFFTGHYIIVACIIVGIILLIRFLRRNEAFMYLWDKKKLKAPKVGKLLVIIYTARFSRTLASLYSSGLTIINALQISKNTIGNRYITKQFDDVIKDVRAGNSLSESLLKIDGFDKKLAQTIAVGEETGQLDTLLVGVADSFDYESAAATKRLLHMIEPVMIIIMAVVVVIVMLSVLLPIFSMYGQIDAEGDMAKDIFTSILF